MSQIPSMLDDWKGRAERFDREVVAPARAATPPDVADKRAVPRLSIAELNELDHDEVFDRLKKQKLDLRGPTTKFLDAIDVPRNLIVGRVLGNAVRRKKEAAGETGTFGEGKVYVSDLLHEMGVRPGLVSGVLGFVGDVAFDPLTYVGAPGGVVKAAGTGGKAALIGRQGVRAIKGAAKSIAEGGAVRSPEVGAAFRAFVEPGAAAKQALADRLAAEVKTTQDATRAAELQDRIRRLSDANTPSSQAARLREKVFGNATGTKGAGSAVVGSIYRPVDEGATELGKKLSARRAAKQEAAKGFVGRYATGAPVPLDDAGRLSTATQLTPKGLAFGGGQSALAHIPFTEYGIYGPGMTTTASRSGASRTLALAKAGQAPAVGAFLRTIKGTEDTARDAQEVRSLSAQIKALEDDIAAGVVPKADVVVGPTHDLLDSDYAEMLGQLRADRKAVFDRMRARDLEAVREGQKDAAGLYDVSDVMYLNRHRQAARAMTRAAEADAAAEPLYKFYAGRSAAEGSFTPGPAIAARDDWNKAVETAARAQVHGSEEGRILLEGMASPEYSPDLRKQLGRQLDDLVATRVQEINHERADKLMDGLLRMSDSDIDTAAAHAEALHQKFQAARRYADAVDGQLLQLTTHEDDVLRELSKNVLGINGDAVDSSVFLGPREAAARYAYNDTSPTGLYQKASDLLEATSRGGRRFFGNRGTDLDNARRTAELMARGASVAEAGDILAPIHAKLENAARVKYNLTGRQIDRFNTLVMLKMYEQQAGANNVRYFLHEIKDGKLVGPSELAKELQAARESGWFDKSFDGGRYADLVKDAEEIAADYNAANAKMAGQLASELPGYVPQMFSPAAERSVVRGGSAATTPSGRPEGFQQQRTSTKYVWQDDKGAYRVLHEGDFALAHRYDNPNALAALETTAPEQHAMISKVRDDVADFEQRFRGLSEDQRRALLGYNSDPWEMNKLNSEGRFDMLWGSQYQRPDEMFTTNAMHAMLNRTAAQVNAQSRRTLADIIDRVALSPSDRVVQTKGANGETLIQFPNGVVGKLVVGSDASPTGRRIIIGDRVYRAPNIDVSKLESNALLGSAMDAERLTRFMPEQAAEALERVFDAGRAENVPAILKASDKIINAWKGFTLAHPAWVAGNVIGSVALAMQGRVPMDRFVSRMKDALTMQFGGRNPAKAAVRTVSVGGRDIPMNEAIGEFRRHAGGGGRYVTALDHDPKDMFPIYGPSLRPTEDAGLSGMSAAFKRRYEARLRQRAVNEAPTAKDKIVAAMRAFGDEHYVRRSWETFAKTNAHIEDTLRTAAWLAFMDQGMDAAQAGAKVREVLLDMGDLTRAEHSVRKHLFPFYAWVRNNAGYQFKKVLEDPKWVGLYPKLKEAVEESVAGDDQVPEHMRPSWMRDQLAIQIGSDPGSRYALTVGNWIPTEPANVLGGAVVGGMEGAQKAIGWLGQGVAPTWAVPLQFGFGREFFTGREIGPEAGRGDVSAGEFLAGQIRPLRELGQIGPRTPPLIRAAEAGPGQFAARLFAGGRAQPFDDERVRSQMVREYKKREEDARRYIAIARRENNEEASIRGRVNLLSIYQSAIQNGLESEVPKWARAQLTLASPAKAD